MGTGSSSTVQQNVGFKDANPAYTYTVDSLPDPTFGQADTNDSDLGSFFERPLKIASFDWGINQPLFEVFDPWSLYFQNPRNINKISNFNLLRCKLHLKIIINGNSFHYGRAIASYTPLPDLDQVSVDRAFFSQDVIQASQKPHIYLDPTTSQGGELCLPFFFFKNALSIPLSEWARMGEVAIHSMQDLKHANAATDRVTISVFAWATDVSLSVPTSVVPDSLSPQSGSDEYGTGPVSKPASVVARIAGKLVSAPIIGPYARATQIASGALAGVAALFGYSRPAILADIEPYKPTVMGNMANCNMPDTCTKLTVDSKQELTIDPRTVGLGTSDEMTIKSIATRESYLTKFAWAVADTTEKRLFQCEVSPMVWDTLQIANNTEVHMPACAFAAMPFRYWSGSMKYRFQIVSSGFHRGRLKIVYDPHAGIGNEYNTQYTQIVDIAEEKDFTVTIGWGNSRAYCNHRHPGEDPVPFNTSSTVGFSAPQSKANGIVSVYIVNELTVPNSIADNDIQVNVFVSAGDDIDFASPSMRDIDYMYYFPTPFGEGKSSGEHFPGKRLLTPQSGEETLGDADGTTEPSAPMHMQTERTMAPPVSETDPRKHVFFGEQITSVRQLLKRYTYHTTFGHTVSGVISRHSANFPYFPGYSSTGINETLDGDPFNYTTMTLLNYFTPAYAGWRGGIRWKAMANGTARVDNSFFNIARVAEEEREFYITEAPIAAGSLSQIAYESYFHNYYTIDGVNATATQQNSCLEYELPYYSALRFNPARRTRFADFTDFVDYNVLTHQSGVKAPNIQSNIALYCAAAEDFSLFWFLGAPIMYFPGGVIPPPSTSI